MVDYSVVTICFFYLCLFGEEGEALGGVDGGGGLATLCYLVIGFILMIKK